MPMFRVTSRMLRQKAQELQQLNSQFKNYVGGLVSQEASLATMWEGEAQKAFRTAFNNDRQQFDQFHEGIKQYIQALLNAAEQYEKAETANVTTAQTRR